MRDALWLYGCIDHDAIVVLLNAFTAAAIIGEHGPLFHYRRKVAPVESEVSFDCIFKLCTSR